MSKQMSKTRHTPGPWVVFVAAEDNAGLSISDVHGIAPIARIPPVYAHGPANARLMAASPDLLAACKAALSSLDNRRRGGLKPDPTFRDWATVEFELKAAVAKAGG